jgi:hypothetical protein
MTTPVVGPRSAIIIGILTAAVGVLLGLQGWRSKLPTYDNLPYMRGGEELITTGRLPYKGNLTSYYSFSPPGPAWLMVPGQLLFTEPRVFESVGSTVLYAGALLGIYLLARTYFGIGCALLSVAMYGLSELGLEMAGSLFARFPIQFFYVWMVYWTVQWVRRRKAKYLTAAIVTWAVGMYVYMEIAPALFILPVVWLFHRPPLTTSSVLIGAIVAAGIWYPYLKFEYGREFLDLRSQIWRQSIAPAQYSKSWCNPGLTLHSLEVGSSTPPHAPEQQFDASSSGWTRLLSRVQSALARANFAVAGLFSNFERAARIRPIKGVMGVLLLLSLAFFSVPTIRSRADPGVRSPLFLENCINTAGVGMLVLAVIANEFIIARYLSIDGILQRSTVLHIRWLQVILAVAGLMLLLMKTRAADWLNRARLADTLRGCHPKKIEVLVLTLVIPWALLLVLVEPNRLDRLWWVWPIQLIFLAALMTYVPEQLRLPRIFAWVGSSCLLFMIAGNALLLSKVSAWQVDGWSGRDPAQLEAIDYVAAQVRAKGTNKAPIGYQMSFWRFEAIFNVLDPAYKVGAEFDFLFRYRGISNTDGCAEGASPDDEFRIVETKPGWSDPSGRGYFDIPPERGLALTQQFGRYQVFQKSSQN